MLNNNGKVAQVICIVIVKQVIFCTLKFLTNLWGFCMKGRNLNHSFWHRIFALLQTSRFDDNIHVNILGFFSGIYKSVKFSEYKDLIFFMLSNLFSNVCGSNI